MHPEWMVAVCCAMLLLVHICRWEKDPAKFENGGQIDKYKYKYKYKYRQHCCPWPLNSSLSVNAMSMQWPLMRDVLAM